MGVYSAYELSELATQLSAVEDWLRDNCTARHGDEMIDAVAKAWNVVDDLYGEQLAAEAAGPGGAP